MNRKEIVSCWQETCLECALSVTNQNTDSFKSFFPALLQFQREYYMPVFWNSLITSIFILGKYQTAYTCLRSTLETREQRLKYVPSQQLIHHSEFSDRQINVRRSFLDNHLYLTYWLPVVPSYRNQSIDLHSKSIDWILYEGKWVKLNNIIEIFETYSKML